MSDDRNKSVRRSERSTKGKKPALFGCDAVEKKGDLCNIALSKRYGKESQYSTNKQPSSVLTSSSSVVRKLQADLKAAREVAKLEEEAERKKVEREKELISAKLEEEAEKKKVEREKELIRMNHELELAEINADSISRREGGSSQVSENICGSLSVRSKVEDWLTEVENKGSHSEDKSHDSNNSIEQLTKVMTEVLTNVKNQNSDKLEKFMVRQSGVSALPTFSGEVEEWPIFLSHYNRSTKVCQFTDEENMARLQKCLRGKAKETVQSLLFAPENLNDVLETLRVTFGRPEYVVMNLIEKARKIAPPKQDNVDSFISFVNAIRNLVSTMEILKETGHMTNPQLMGELVKKLPAHLELQWGTQVVNEKHGVATLRDFSNWLNGILKIICYVNVPFKSEKREDVRRIDNFQVYRKNFQRRDGLAYKKNETVMTMKSFDPLEEASIEICTFCNAIDHEIGKCAKFKEEEINERWKFVTRNKLCFCCLKSRHRSFYCKEKTLCGVEGCKSKHNPVLHFKKQMTECLMAEKKERVHHMSFEGEEIAKVLLRIVPVKVRSENVELSTYALLDDASTVTLIDSEIADKLALNGPVEPFCYQWTNQVTRSEDDSRRVGLQISGMQDDAKMYKIASVRTVKGLSLPTQTVNMKQLEEKWGYLKNIRIASLVNAKPTILIGQDNGALIVARKVIDGPGNTPIASKTLLGWSVHGRASKMGNCIENKFTFHLCHAECDRELHQLVKENFTTESFGVRMSGLKSRSREDKRAEIVMENTTKRIGNRFETGLLWKNENTSFPESKTNAYRRLLCTERRMDKEKEFADQYCKKILEYVEKGYARKLTIEEAEEVGPRTWYLPHFGVTNPNKPGKLRLVFDAAAKSHGVSLNDELLQGPDLLASLVGVLMKFRQRSIAFSADIKEMFHQVIIRQEDRQSQRFLWREMDRDREPDTFEMRAMIFGATSSPCLAQYVKNRNALEFKNEFPEAATAITNRHYVDDYLDSMDTEKEALDRITDVIKVHAQGGFQICNWICSSKAVMKKIPQELCAQTSKNLNHTSQQPIERILGMWWMHESDNFTFVLNLHKVDQGIINGTKIPTKREVLGLVMSVFDPLGFLSILTIKAKIFLQDIWRSGLGWDDELTNEMYQKWKKWLAELRNIDTIQIPRCYGHGLFKSKQVELHTFCDASEKAFSAVVYIRFKNEDGYRVAFVIGKTRVAPLKPMTIPRLELQAALMASRLTKTVSNELEVETSRTYYWTDSRTVLYWLQNESRRFKTFVSFRVGEIEELTNISDWRWIPTKYNVADDATRSNVSVFDSERWFHGPEFLKKPETEWSWEKGIDASSKLNEEWLEIKKEFVNVTSVILFTGILPDINRISSFTKLIRVTAWILRYINKIQKKSSYVIRELFPDELKEAEKMWIKRVQRESFPKDMKLLENGKTVTKEGKLLQLSPMLDCEGVMRLQGRIEASKTADINTKRPIILDPKHRFTRLLIQHYHERARHNGQEFVVNELRQTYWILNIRHAVRSTWNACQFCKNRRTKPQAPEMGQLPSVRLGSLQRIRPFSYTGMDYFGPMEVTIGRHHEKRYGVIFTCLTTRAIHLEIAHSLTTDSCIMAIRRLIGRRGNPVEIWSDNGTNFKGAEKELKAALENLNQNRIIGECTQAKIKWTFIPPAAPHMGGCWERLVRSVKTVLKVILKERAPKEEILATLLIEVENMVNSRPLTHVSIDPDDEESLTPNHFLVGTSSSVQTPGVFSDNDFQCRKQWRIAQRLADHFWKRWLREYLPTLTRRTKWFTQSKSVKIGDIVIIVDDNAPRNMWPRGRITAIYPGSDGKIRTADVKTNTGTYRRPVVKLCVLDIIGDE